MYNEYDEYKFRLARYLLNYDENIENSDLNTFEYNVDINLYNTKQLLHEIDEILNKLKVGRQSSLSGFHTFSHVRGDRIDLEREEKHELLEHHQTYDKYILAVLVDFCIMTIALLVKLERMHNKHILCGHINPYTFMYSKKNKSCEPYNIGVVLSDKNVVRAEKQKFGDFIYVVTDLGAISYNEYLAPELKESVRVYHLQKRLKDLVRVAENRGILLPQKNEIISLLRDFHQKQVKYSNRAEIYSVGYTINQILSHSLSKLAHYGLLMNNFSLSEVSSDVLHEAGLLLPDEFANPEKERIIELLNEAIIYVHDLMKTHMEQRDTLKVSIEKFMSLLKRTSLTKPDDILGEEEEKDYENMLAEIEEALEEFETEELEEAEHAEAEEHEEEEKEEAEEREAEEAEEHEEEEAEEREEEEEREAEEAEEKEEAEEREAEEAEEKEEAEEQEVEEKEEAEAEEKEEEEHEKEEAEEKEEEEREERTEELRQERAEEERIEAFEKREEEEERAHELAHDASHADHPTHSAGHGGSHESGEHDEVHNPHPDDRTGHNARYDPNAPMRGGRNPGPRIGGRH